MRSTSAPAHKRAASVARKLREQRALRIELTLAVDAFPIAGRFVISRGAKTEALVVTATLRDGDAIGRGECVPYARYGESVGERASRRSRALRGAIEAGADRAALAAAAAGGRGAQRARLRPVGSRGEAQRRAAPFGARGLRDGSRRSSPPIRSRVGTPEEMRAAARAAARPAAAQGEARRRGRRRAPRRRARGRAAGRG